jgi:hypothetical protein
MAILNNNEIGALIVTDAEPDAARHRDIFTILLRIGVA